MQGLQNLGSTCAINSLIQIICRTDHLRDIILNGEIPSGTLSAELKEILHMMHIDNHSLSPKKFVAHLYKHFEGIFRQGEQIDIGELWMFLFDRLATELAHNTVAESTEVAQQSIDISNNQQLASNESLVKQCMASMNKFNNNKTSLWLDTSQGIMMNIIVCNQCNNISYNFEPFISIQLDIPETEGGKLPSVAGMFRNYLKPHTCMDDWKCEKCNQCTSYTKSLKIWKMPKVLIFIIKRFANVHIKNINPISINKTLSIKKGSILSNMGTDYNYNCTSLGYHFGGLAAGHYCAVCKTGDKFILYDDLNISVIQDEHLQNVFECNKDGYMIVYTTQHLQ